MAVRFLKGGGLGRNEPTDEFESLVRSIQEEEIEFEKGSRIASSQAINTRPLRRHKNNKTNRTAWIMSTVEWLLESNTPKALVWFANPSDISWDMPTRSAHSKNLVGTVNHVWPDNFRDTFFDEFKLQFSFQSGSLLPVLINPSEFEKGDLNDIVTKGNVDAPGGISNFYDLMSLIDAPKLTAGTDTSPPRTNNVIIKYHSNMFPDLTLIGMFDGALRFQDSSSNPNKVHGWSADFIVYDTAPRLSDNVGGKPSPANSLLLERWLKTKLGLESTSVGNFTGNIS